MSAKRFIRQRARDASHQPFGTVAAIIADDVTSFDQRVGVIIPSISRDFRFGPCRWQARDETSLPSRGDDCFVAFDDRGHPWVLAWWPFIT